MKNIKIGNPNFKLTCIEFAKSSDIFPPFFFISENFTSGIDILKCKNCVIPAKAAKKILDSFSGNKPKKFITISFGSDTNEYKTSESISGKPPL